MRSTPLQLLRTAAARHVAVWSGCALFALGVASADVHDTLVAHGICAAHGEVIDLAKVVPPAHGRSTTGTAWQTPDVGGPIAGAHQHCAVATSRVSPRQRPQLAKIAARNPGPKAPAVPRPVTVARSRAYLLCLAPKSSPPAA